MRAPAATAGVLAILFAAITATGAPAAGTAPPPENQPGEYVTPPSRSRKIVVHVSADGSQIVGMGIKMNVKCQHGYYLPDYHTSPFFHVHPTIVNHVVRETVETFADREDKTGHIDVYLHFTAPGALEGRLSAHIPERNPKVGLCADTLKFTAKIRPARGPGAAGA
jgi:hypothetical protein